MTKKVANEASLSRSIKPSIKLSIKLSTIVKLPIIKDDDKLSAFIILKVYINYFIVNSN